MNFNLKKQLPKILTRLKRITFRLDILYLDAFSISSSWAGNSTAAEGVVAVLAFWFVVISIMLTFAVSGADAVLLIPFLVAVPRENVTPSFAPTSSEQFPGEYVGAIIIKTMTILSYYIFEHGIRKAAIVFSFSL